MASQIAVVTGTNTGVGLALSVLLAKSFKVYATMRSLSKGDELKKQAEAAGVTANLVPIVMDVNDDESVEKAFHDILEKEGRVDLLVNNAGYSVFGTVEMLSVDKCKEQFNTNFFGVIRCQKQAIPVMRKQRSGKIINITSVGGVWGQPFNDVYCASKFAVEGLAESQAALLRTFNIYETCVQPGGIKTAFVENAARPDMSTVPEDYVKPMMSTVAAYGTNPTSQTAEEVAQVVMDQVVHVEHPPLKVQTNPAIQAVFKAQLADTTGEQGVKLQARFFPKDE